MLTAISMFSPCTQWVFGPLPPVYAGECRWRKTQIMRNSGNEDNEDNAEIAEIAESADREDDS